MNCCLKSVLVLFTVVFAMGAFSVEDAVGQGPIIRKMRERLNGGKPLLPFVEDIEQSLKPEPPRKRPTPAAKSPTPATKKDSVRRTPTPAKSPTPAVKAPQTNPTIKLQSPSAASSQIESAKGFGMMLQEQGESFVVSNIDPRGNAAAAGLRRGDVIENIGGAPIQVIEEFEAIAKAMKGGDRVEFEVSRRGSKPEKVIVQYGKPEPVKEVESNMIEIAPAELEPAPALTTRQVRDRYEPAVGSGLNSVYDSSDKPSSVFTPTPVPPANKVESLDDLDFPALDGGK